MKSEALNEAIDRIKRMELCFDKLQQAAAEGVSTTDNEPLLSLRDYYENGMWLHDYELDEQGLLPDGLKRGVLSQDGVYNLLTELNIAACETKTNTPGYAIQYKCITNPDYEIDCKLFLPAGGDVQGIAIGVHGFGGDKESSAISGLAEALCAQGKALICFDFPCHGASTVGEECFTVENCMRDLEYVAEHCRQEYPNVPKYIFATSFGGYITLLCADKLADFKICLRAPAVTMPQHILLDILGVTADEFKAAGVIRCGYERPMLLPYSFYEDLLCHDVFERTYEREMLIIQGDADDVVPLEDIHLFCGAHRMMTLEIIEGADHRFKKPGELEKVIRIAAEYFN